MTRVHIVTALVTRMSAAAHRRPAARLRLGILFTVRPLVSLSDAPSLTDWPSRHNNPRSSHPDRHRTTVTVRLPNASTGAAGRYQARMRSVAGRRADSAGQKDHRAAGN